MNMPNGSIQKKMKPIFPGQPVVSDRVPVLSSMFLSTNIPHRVTLSKDKRLIISLRFEGKWDVSQFKTALQSKDIHG